MTDDSDLDRREFLRASGAVGTGAVLASLSAGSASASTSGDRGAGVSRSGPRSSAGGTADQAESQFFGQYVHPMVRAPAARDAVRRTNPDSEVTIAFVGYGVDYDHRDLEPRFGENVGESLCWSFPWEEDDPAPVLGLSRQYAWTDTQSAGIAAATVDGSPADGVAGIDGVNLLTYRIVGRTTLGETEKMVAAIETAVDDGADIICVTRSQDAEEEIGDLRAAIDYAVENGVLPIAGATSAGLTGGEKVEQPAQYDNCLGVNVIDENEELAGQYSTKGEGVDVLAPGEEVHTTNPETSFRGRYHTTSHPAIAAGVVAGVAALVELVDPDIGPMELRDRIRNTAADLGLEAKTQGGGRVDALDAVAAGGGTFETSIEGEITEEKGGHELIYDPRLDDPAEIVFELDGDEAADFDLYLSVDGRPPTHYDYDRTDRSFGPEARIELDGDETDRRIGVLVHAYKGTGEFALTVHERA